MFPSLARPLDPPVLTQQQTHHRLKLFLSQVSCISVLNTFNIDRRVSGKYGFG